MKIKNFAEFRKIIPDKYTGTIEHCDGTEHVNIMSIVHWKNGSPHRQNAPAIEQSNGVKQWFLNGICHRIDGPAIEALDGESRWFVNGKAYPKVQWEIEVEILKKLRR
jgi:hypothetical protein